LKDSIKSGGEREKRETLCYQDPKEVEKLICSRRKSMYGSHSTERNNRIYFLGSLISA
jgi:hypothetical protein